MPDPRVAFCIFCDSLRNETGNKVSLMGVYGNDLNFNHPKPGLLPTFVIVVYLIYDLDDRPSRMTMRVIGPDKSEIVKAEVPMDFPTSTPRKDSKKNFARLMLQLQGLTILDDGDIEVYVDTESGSLRAGRLAVRFAVPEVAPASASANDVSPTTKQATKKPSRAAAKKKAKKH